MNIQELADRYEDNVIGRYFVDTQCIDCDLCRETAPNNFTRQTEEGYSYVINNPRMTRRKKRVKKLWRIVPLKQQVTLGLNVAEAVAMNEKTKKIFVYIS